MYDPRIIANLIVDEALAMRQPVTNLALQKLLYFTHALFLIERKQPLVTGYFEAWQYGPVHPAVYQSFKVAGDQPITFRAAGRDAMSGQSLELAPPNDPEVLIHVRRIMASYGRLTPGRLVDISHAKDAPWHFVVENSKSNFSIGLRITDNVILERFKHHKVSVASVPTVGEPGVDAPILAPD